MKKIIAFVNNKNEETTLDDPGAEAYYFADQYELIMYAKHCKDAGIENSVKWLSGSKYNDLFMKGYNLFELGRYAKALRAYQDALRVNPVGIKARFEICECYLHMGNLSEAKKTLLDMQEYVIEDCNVARFYRRMGYIATEQKEYPLAIACYMLSLQFEQNQYVGQELLYIRSVAGKLEKPANPEPIVKAAGIPILEAYTFTDRTSA